jgi:alcohol dehydrogenase, propanol-preferring
VLNGIMVRGSIVRTILELTEVYELHADGRTKIRRESWPLEEVNQCFAEVLEGRTHKPRIVFQP